MTQFAEDALERKAENVLERAAIMQRLVDAFGGHPEEYEWDGMVAEGDPSLDKCACGHPIRFIFNWVHRTSGHVVRTGSVCVETVPGLDPEMVSRIQTKAQEILRKVAEERRARAKAEKDALAASEIQDLLQAIKGRWQEVYGQISLAGAVTWDNLDQRREEARNHMDGGFTVWSAVQAAQWQRWTTRALRFKRRCDQIRHLKDILSGLKAAQPLRARY